MKTNNMNINSMKKYSKYICLFLMLVGMSVNAWGAKTGTIYFGTTSGYTRINAASVTGNDDLGNTWKIVTAGTTSYTGQGTYYQVGKNGEGASSITFGVKLPKVVSVTSFSAKFGGFSGTAGSITLKVTNKSTSSTSSVGSGSLSETSDVTVENSSSGTGDSLTVIVTPSSAKGVKCYYISYTYANASAYTITFNAEKGTSAESSLTESSANEGITLPDVDVDDDVEAAGWEFAGWASSTCSETTVAPRLYIVGDPYYPEEDETLYAVYRKLTDGTSTSTATFTASTQSGLTNIGSDPDIAYWWLHTESGVEFYINNYGIYNSAFNLDDSKGKGNGWAFLDAHRKIKQVVFTASSESYLIDEIEAYDDGDVEVTTSGTTQTVVCSGNVTQLLLDAPASGQSYITTFTVTYYDTRFNSDPCANVVSLSVGTESHAEITSFSETGVETCSSTDANRQVTVSVTADTGYELTSSARLTFTKSSGTATASYVSGPTGSGPNYTFVYQFTKDDSGAGTFSVTATAKQSAITFDKNEGEGGLDGTTATYDAAMPDITPPTRTGYTFDGYWDAETDNNGSGNQYYKADGTSKKNWDKNTTSATTLYAKWNINSYTLAIASVDHVTISSTSPSVAAGSSTSVNYGTTVTLSHGTPSDGRTWSGWNAYKTGDTGTPVAVNGSNQFTMPAYDVTVSANLYGDFVFSCSELTLTPHLVTASTPIFITSTASTTVRSQDYIEISGNGLTPSTELTFPDLPAKFAIKNADGTAISTDGSGEISANAYIFYTPGAGDTSDGLDKLTGITVSVGGAKPKTVNLTQDIIGRHLPADFVIACKRGSKWYALPANMSELTNPGLVEIAVDDINNPTVAYTATSNIYNLYGQSSGAGYLEEAGQYIKLGQKNNSNKPLFGSATGTSTIKGDGTAGVTSNLNKQYWWLLTQTKTGEVTAATAQYSISCANNTAPLVLKENAGNPQWGFYTTGSVGPLRIIPASESSVVFAEASVVAWGQHSAIIETDAGTGTVLATKVVGKLPEDIETTKKSISQTGTSVKGTGTRYNYTVNFGSGEGGIDFSANEGKMLTLEWYNSSDVLVAVSNVMVPRIVATNTTINKANYGTKGVWNTEVHVLPGDTLFIDASAYDKPNLTINELHVYPNATVQVLKDTLIVKNLIMRNGWNRLTAEKEYDVARLYIKSGTGNGTLKATNAYMDWYIDYDQYYPIAVPWQVATSAITYKNMTVAIDQGLIIRHYDGERHAKGGKDGDGNTNWKQYTWGDDMPENLVPGIGYAMTARRPAGKAFSIVRMPLTIPSAAWTTLGEQGEVSSVHKDQVSVTAWVKEEGETPKHAKGWNFIANPYMSIYEGAITHSVDAEYNIEYVNIPDVNFKEFEQLSTETTKLKPGSGFLIQTEETGMLTFGTTHRKASAPSYLAQTPKASKQKAYILLSGNEAFDQMGLIISDNYTADYEVNADLEKLLSDGNTLRTYMIYNNLNMAYVAINDTLAREWIPVSVRVPESGEYAFSLHSASKVSELEGIYLIDYTNNVVTNLIENNYSFMATEGTIAGRFAINAIVGKHDTPTDVDIINAGGDIKSNQPFKFIYNDKVFILHNGIIYDSTGKKVREIKK